MELIDCGLFAAHDPQEFFFVCRLREFLRLDGDIDTAAPRVDGIARKYEHRIFLAVAFAGEL